MAVLLAPKTVRRRGWDDKGRRRGGSVRGITECYLVEAGKFVGEEERDLCLSPDSSSPRADRNNRTVTSLA